MARKVIKFDPTKKRLRKTFGAKANGVTNITLPRFRALKAGAKSMKGRQHHAALENFIHQNKAEIDKAKEGLFTVNVRIMKLRTKRAAISKKFARRIKKHKPRKFTINEHQGNIAELVEKTNKLLNEKKRINRRIKSLQEEIIRLKGHQKEPLKAFRRRVRKGTMPLVFIDGKYFDAYSKGKLELKMQRRAATADEGLEGKGFFDGLSNRTENAIIDAFYSRGSERLQYAKKLVKINPSKSIPVLVQLSKDPNRATRAFALQKLVELSGKKAMNNYKINAGFIRQRMKDRDPHVRRDAARAITQFGSKRDIPFIKTVLKSEKRRQTRQTRTIGTLQKHSSNALAKKRRRIELNNLGSINAAIESLEFALEKLKHESKG